MRAGQQSTRLCLLVVDQPTFALRAPCVSTNTTTAAWRNTATSLATVASRPCSKLGFHVDVDTTLWLRSRAAMAPAALPRVSDGADAAATTVHGIAHPPAAAATAGCGGLLAVVEVVLVERSDAGVACAEYSAAWCAIPLELPGGASAACGSAACGSGAPAPASRRPGAVPAALGCCGVATQAASLARAPQPRSPCSPLRAGVMAARLGAHSTLCVPLFVGSPRWLACSASLPLGQCPPPPQLLADGAACRLHFQASGVEVDVWEHK